MKKTLAMIIVLVLIGTYSAESESTCPPWLTIPGECLTDVAWVVSSGVGSGSSLTIHADDPVIWTAVAEFKVPMPPVLFTGSNLNKFKLELKSLWVDRRVFEEPPADTGDFADSLVLELELVCHEDGNDNPSLEVAFPAQYILRLPATLSGRMR